MHSADEPRQIRKRLFDAAEKHGRERLDKIVPNAAEPPSDAVSLRQRSAANAPEGLAERTCRKIWNTVDHPAERRIIPKFAHFERTSSKTTPYVLKTVSIQEEPCVTLEATSISPQAPSLDELKQVFERQKAIRPKRRRNRCPLCNGEIREEAKEEYYWEVLDADTPSPSAPPCATTDRPSPSRSEPLRSESRHDENKPRTGENLWVESVTQIGQSTIDCLGSAKDWISKRGPQTMLPEEMNRPISDVRRGKSTDMLISVIVGILIATTIVFPSLRFVGRELYVVIVKSTVRRIGQTVPINNEHNSSDLLPFISEQILFPQSHEAEFMPAGLETSASETDEVSE